MSHFQPWPYPRVLAHRGAGTFAPENTVAALRVGLEYGYHAVEFDAMLASDDVPVLIHDETLMRTAGTQGEVSEKTARELGALDAGAWHSSKFAGEHIPQLSQALDFCRSNEIWPNVEIKPAVGHEARTGKVVASEVARVYGDVVRAGGDRAENAEPRVPVLSSFSREALIAARIAAPDVPRGALVGQVPDHWEQELEYLAAVALHCDHKRLTRDMARAVKDAGYWLFCYTVNTPERAQELMDWGVDAYCTDRIDILKPD